MADVLAQETFDALAKFLHAVNVLLRHAPGTVRGIRLARLERLDLLFHPDMAGRVIWEEYREKQNPPVFIVLGIRQGRRTFT